MDWFSEPGSERPEDSAENTSSGFQLRFKPDADNARWIQDVEVAVSDTELWSFEAIIFAGSVMVPIMPTILPG